MLHDVKNQKVINADFKSESDHSGDEDSYSEEANGENQIISNSSVRAAGTLLVADQIGTSGRYPATGLGAQQQRF
jgi:hypothetical protein